MPNRQITIFHQMVFHNVISKDDLMKTNPTLVAMTEETDKGDFTAAK